MENKTITLITRVCFHSEINFLLTQAGMPLYLNLLDNSHSNGPGTYDGMK